ncbi:hypothetical protein P3T73_01340 [Kiritimatiellota bacterium B12222]|nr:hypothetical protein P3T73_01340 [Kiritimatiellota bacterium B12222]
MKFFLFICVISGILAISKKWGWSPKLITLATVGTTIVFGLLLLVTGIGKSTAPDLETLVLPEKSAAYLLGEAVRAQLPSGGTVLLFQDELPDPEPLMQKQPAARAEGLQESLGEAYTVIRVNSLEREETEFNPATGMWILQVSDYAALVEKYGPADAVVTFSGLPHDLQNLSTLGIPFFAYLYAPTPPPWTSELPKGLNAIVSPKPGTLPSDLAHKQSTSELAENAYILIPSLP